jgi:hypothetical protein
MKNTLKAPSGPVTSRFPWTGKMGKNKNTNLVNVNENRKFVVALAVKNSREKEYLRSEKGVACKNRLTKKYIYTQICGQICKIALCVIVT